MRRARCIFSVGFRQAGTFNSRIACFRGRCQSTVAYVWGAGDGGQLGHWIKETNSTPVLYPVEKEISHIGCGYGFTVTSEKRTNILWTCGVNSLSQCGTTFTDIVSKPCRVELPVQSPNTRIEQIACGRSHTLVLTDCEGVFALGGNSQGQCGLTEKTGQSIKHFEKIHIQDVDSTIVKVICGLDHSLFLTDAGQVYACGWGADGQTGQGHFHDQPAIKQVQGHLEGVFVKDIASSVDCCLALSENGEVFSWGNSEYNQLGIETKEQQISLPTKSTLLDSLGKVEHVASAGSMCVLVTEEGVVYTWGYGVLGHGSDVISSKSPKRIKALDELGEQITQVHCGLDHCALVTVSGKLFVWGRGSFGRLGLRNTEDQWTPSHVSLPGIVQEVSCGVDHMGVIVQTS